MRSIRAGRGRSGLGSRRGPAHGNARMNSRQDNHGTRYSPDGRCSARRVGTRWLGCRRGQTRSRYPMNAKKRSGLGLLFLGFAALGGCATGPAPVSAPMPRSILLAPTAVEGRLAGQLEAGVPTVHKLIGQVLWEQDVQVGTLSSEELAAIWEIASRSVALEDAARDPERTRDLAVDAVVDTLRAKGSRFDALVIPYLVVRNGSINGTSVWWDGVRRQLPVDAPHRHNVLMPMRRGLRRGHGIADGHDGDVARPAGGPRPGPAAPGSRPRAPRPSCPTATAARSTRPGRRRGSPTSADPRHRPVSSGTTIFSPGTFMSCG